MKKLLILSLLICATTTVYSQSDTTSYLSIKSFTLLVKDYDEAIDFYVSKLQFELISDINYGDKKRWVSIKAPNSDIQLILSKVGTEEYEFVGRQSGTDYPLFVLGAKDVVSTYNKYVGKGVKFLKKPSQEPWGLGALFEDLYGNKIYLQSIQ